MCKKLCPTCSCVDKIPVSFETTPPKHFLYIDCKMVDGTPYRIYGPHVYRFVSLVVQGEEFTNWYPTDIPANNVLDNAVETIYVE